MKDILDSMDLENLCRSVSVILFCDTNTSKTGLLKAIVGGKFGHGAISVNALEQITKQALARSGPTFHSCWTTYIGQSQRTMF